MFLIFQRSNNHCLIFCKVQKSKFEGKKGKKPNFSRCNHFRQQNKNGLISLTLRPVVPGGSGRAMAPPDFDRSVNPIQTGESRLCPQHYYLPQQIFIPSCGPAVCLLRSDVWTAAVKTNQPITVGYFFLIVQYYCRLLKSQKVSLVDLSILKTVFFLLFKHFKYFIFL